MDINVLQESLPEWTLLSENGVGKLERKFSFKNFVDALAFTNLIGALAEVQNHHPTIVVEWGKVSLCWWSHDVKGLTDRDLLCAQESDLIYNS